MIRKMAAKRAHHEVPELQELLSHGGSGGIRANFGGTENRLLYAQSYSGTKELVDRYVNEGG